MAALRPFFSYYGSKWRLAGRYPKPKYDTIIEPFAGSAGYSLNYPDRNIVLVERDPVVSAVWRWLINCEPRDIASLPIVKRGDTLDDLDISPEAKSLMGFWVNQSGARPSNKVTQFGAVWINKSSGTEYSRVQMYKDRVVKQLPAIRHWSVINDSYAAIPNRGATWFIDPPYHVEGKKYVYGPKQIDYAGLAGWCRSRLGQTIVCENEGATWLPFEQFARLQGAVYNGRTVWSDEVMFYQETSGATDASG